MYNQSGNTPISKQGSKPGEQWKSYPIKELSINGLH